MTSLWCRAGAAIGLLGIGLVVPASAGAATAEDETPTYWLVTNPNADGSVEVQTGSATIDNLDTATVISCPAIEASGSAPTGEIYWNYSVLDLFPIAYRGCSGPGGVPLEAYSLPWGLMAESYDPDTDRVTGWVWDDYDLVWVYRPDADCTYTLIAPDSGNPEEQADFTYDNRSSTLEVTHPGLVVDQLSGTECESLARPGDTVTFSATFDVTPAVTIRPA